jgi:hypothetical protein
MANTIGKRPEMVNAATPAAGPSTSHPIASGLAGYNGRFERR